MCRFLEAVNEETGNQYKQMCKTAMQKKTQIHFLGYYQGAPASCATLTTLPTSCGIWNCATLPQFRKKGLNTAVCYTALSEAKKRKYPHIIATLLPTGLAWRMFQSIGFKEDCLLPYYVYGN